MFIGVLQLRIFFNVHRSHQYMYMTILQQALDVVGLEKKTFL